MRGVVHAATIKTTRPLYLASLCDQVFHSRGVSLDNREIDLSCRVGLASMLFPVAQGADGQSKSLSKLALRHAARGPDRLDVDRPHNARASLITVRIGNSVVQPRSDLVKSTLHFFALLNPSSSVLVNTPRALRSALVRLSFSFLPNTVSRNVGKSSPAK